MERASGDNTQTPPSQLQPTQEAPPAGIVIDRINRLLQGDPCLRATAQVTVVHVECRLSQILLQH